LVGTALPGRRLTNLLKTKTMQPDRTWTRSDLLTLACVVIVHGVALFALQMALRSRPPPSLQPSFEALRVFFFDEPQPEEPLPPVVSDLRHLPLPKDPPSQVTSPSAEPSTAPTTLPPIDWELEAQRAVQRFAESLPSEPGKAKPKKKSEFGWSHSRINRIEQTEDGATLFWISDRCFLVNFQFPMCKFGDIPANGDLFKGMEEWKDQREP